MNNQDLSQVVGQVKQMFQQGQQIHNILLSLKNRGFTPQIAEQILFMAFPNLQQTQMQIKNSGMNTQQFMNQLAKQNNLPINEINSNMENMIKMFN